MFRRCSGAPMMAARRATARIDSEHAMLAEAATRWSATESIDRKLGERIIAALREINSAYQDVTISGPRQACRRFERAMAKSDWLVSKP
jgi:type IV secretory pathway TrbL component